MSNDLLVPGFDGLSDEPWQFRLSPWEDQPEGLVVHTFGPLHAYNEDVLFRKVEMILDRGYRRLVLDLAGSIWPDRGFHARLMVVRGLVRQTGGELALIRVHPQVELSFDLNQEDKVGLNIRRTLDEAGAFFRHREAFPDVEVFPVVAPCPFCGRKFRATRPGGYRCCPEDCGWSLRIEEDGSIGPFHDHLVPGFDALPLESLAVTVSPLPSVEGGLLFRHAGYLDARDEGAYRDRVQKAQAAGYTRLVLDCGQLQSTRYSFFHRSLFTGKVQGSRHLVLVGVPPQWRPFWEEDGWPAPPCALVEGLDQAVEKLQTLSPAD